MPHRRPRQALLALALSLWMLAPVWAEAIARIDAVSGLVEVQRGDTWYEAVAGDELHLADELRTDVDALARVVFYDEDGDSGAKPTVMDLDSETHVTVHELKVEVDASAPPRRTGFVEVLRGVLNTITKGWGSGSLFSVKAGTTVCGIRGSIANVGYDPEAGEEPITVTAIDGEMYTFEAEGVPQALERHRTAMSTLRQDQRAEFLERLEAGQAAHWGPKARRRLQRLDPKAHQAARLEMLLGHSRRGEAGLESGRRWGRKFASVKRRGVPKRMAKGRKLRKHFRQLEPAERKQQLRLQRQQARERLMGRGSALPVQATSNRLETDGAKAKPGKPDARRQKLLEQQRKLQQQRRQRQQRIQTRPTAGQRRRLQRRRRRRK